MLTPIQQKALAALIECRTQEEAAKQVGLTQRTLANYLRNKEFQSAYRAAIGDLVTAATDELKRGLADAVCLLREVIQEPKESTNSRITAARTILEYALRFAEFTDILGELRMITGNH